MTRPVSDWAGQCLSRYRALLAQQGPPEKGPDTHQQGAGGEGASWGSATLGAEGPGDVARGDGAEPAAVPSGSENAV